MKPIDETANESDASLDHVHIIGIGGSATRGLACFLRQRRVAVSGSDLDSDAQEVLEQHGVKFCLGHDSKNVGSDVGTVIHTRAVDKNNPELLEAKRRAGVEVFTYSEYLGRLSQGFRTVAIAGTHGKTSTTACLLSVFLAAGRDPSMIAGGEFLQVGAGWRAGKGDEFLVEACEFERAFLDLRPHAAIITNIDLDHPEVYSDLDSVTETFRQFVDGFEPGSWVVCPPHIKDRMEKRTDLRWRTYGTCESADVSLLDSNAGLEDGLVRWRLPEGDELTARLQVPGAHSRENATAVVAFASALGLDSNDIVTGLESYPGVVRRFESCEVLPGIDWVEDYAHHPEEVKATIATAREVFPDRRCQVLFQPHQATRLDAFQEQFAIELTAADKVNLVPIYSVRENLGDFPEDLLERLAQKIRSLGTECQIFDFEEAVRGIPEIVQPGDVFISLGAGNVNEIGRRIGRQFRNQVSQ